MREADGRRLVAAPFAQSSCDSPPARNNPMNRLILLVSAAAAIGLLGAASGLAAPQAGSGQGQDSQNPATHAAPRDSAGSHLHGARIRHASHARHRPEGPRGDLMTTPFVLNSDDVRLPPSHPELNHNLKAPHPFNAGSYRPPQDYLEHRWSFGDRLPAAYSVREHWLSDYAQYGLFAPPDGLRWIRVGADALLIEPSSGEVVQVDYLIFQ